MRKSIHLAIASSIIVLGLSSCSDQTEPTTSNNVENLDYITQLALSAANCIEQGNARSYNPRSVTNPTLQIHCISSIKNNEMFGLYAVDYDNEQGYAIVTNAPGADPILAVVEKNTL